MLLSFGGALVCWMLRKKRDVELKPDLLIFVGTGCSTGIPETTCLVNGPCPACRDTLNVGSRNKRRNTSILLQHQGKNVLIDCGKFFYQASIDVFPAYEVSHLNSVLFTHDHMDACGGLDDLRNFTDLQGIKVYSREKDFKTIERIFSYLVDPSKASGSGYVSDLSFLTFKNDQESLLIEGIEIQILPVEHGPGYISNGYRFGNVAYVSDVSVIPEETYAKLKNLDILILDCLADERRTDHKPQVKVSHLFWEDSIEQAKKIGAKKTYFVGMCHRIEHHSANEKLRELKRIEGIDIEMAYDGLSIPIDLKK